MLWKPQILAALFVLGASPMAFAEEKSSWISSDFSLGNSVGLGTFFTGYGSMPQWTTSLTVAPSVNLPLPSSWPRISVDAEVSANVWWLNSMETSAYDVSHRIQFPDLLFSISAPSLYEFSNIGISFSAAIPIVVPISKSSLALNRWISLGFGAGVKWKKKQFSASFSPSARAWIHGGEAKVIGCYDSSSPSMSLLNPQNADFEVDQYMMSLTAFRDEENIDGSTCAIVGRQNTWTLKLPVGASFATESHRVSASLGYYWNFLRPLEDRPELASPNSSSQSFTQAVLGKIAYTYALPLRVDLAVSTGVISYQSVFSKTGTPLFPFFDFVTPIKNQTQVFVEMIASL